MASNKSIPELEDIASQVRRDILRMVHSSASGHPGGSLGCTDYFVALFFEVMDINLPFQMDAHDEDVFFLSNGHISPVFYSILARRGYFEVNELKTFRQIDSRLQGHPATHEGLPGIRVASGSLGQGLSVASGMAEGKKLDKDPHTVYILMGDGEQQEGQIWEAAMYAAHRKLDNLVATIDYNGRQIDGDVDDIMSLKSLRDKYESFGWEVVESNGNDMKEIVDALNYCKDRTGNGKPIMNLMKTEMGYPIDFMVGSHKWHGIAPNDEQLESALSQVPETLGDYS